MGRVDGDGAVALRDDEFIDAASSGAASGNTSALLRLEHIAARLVEIAAAITGLVLFSPLLLIASISIRVDSRGPVLVREARYGYKNRPIQVFRFRLVRTCAEGNRSGPRLTRVGRLLSQTGIDELPGLINVLRGEMSVIGHPPSARPKTLNWAKPGMIRWSQIVATISDADPR